MKKLLTTALIALACSFGMPALAQPGPTHNTGGIAGYDSAADAHREYCVDQTGTYVGCGGSGGGGSGLGGTANAAAPGPVVEGSTVTNFSFDLNDYLRVRAKQDGTWTVNIAAAQTIAISGSVAVTGTFWQATQPVSGTFFQTTQPVSIASLPALTAGSAKVGQFAIDQTTPGTTDSITPKATENHTGEVGGNLLPITAGLTVTASSAYTAGNAVGGLVTLSNAVRLSGSLGASGTSGLFQDVTINMKSAQTAQIDVFFFNANPTSSTCTDKTAFVLATADFNKVIGVAHVSDWTAGNVASVGQANNFSKGFGIASGTTAYACAVTRGTPTFTATSDPSLTLNDIRN